MTKIDKKIRLLKDAKKNSLTEDTIKNLAEGIRKELVKEERYEECAEITKLESKLLKSFKHDKKKLVSKVGLSKNELDDLMNL
jgi:transcriptional regulator with AAA-type ATPase domain